MSALRGARVLVLERPHPADHPAALVSTLLPLLRSRGASVERRAAELGVHRLDERPDADLVVLKSGSAAALHLAAAAEAWGVPCVNTAAATRLAQDKPAVALMLQGAGQPIAHSRALWLDPAEPPRGLDDRPVVLKAARGSQGRGVWRVPAGGLSDLARTLPAGPYLVMEDVGQQGEDLKVYVAGAWMTAIRRPFPARTAEAKTGRPYPVPADVADVARAVGRWCGLTCFGADFVEGPRGWVLVDVNAFPGYKGALGADEAIAQVLSDRISAELPSLTGRV